MNKFLLLSLFVVLSCFPQNKEDVVSSTEPEVHFKTLSEFFSAEEKTIQKCFISIKFKCSDKECEESERKNCLAGTSYDNKFARNPSSYAMKAEMVSQNNWFFGSETNLLLFWDVLKGLKKAHKKMKEVLGKGKKFVSQKIHGRGIAFYGSAYIGVGSGWMGELINHRNELALFCAPSSFITTDAGVEAGVLGATTLACNTNYDYTGAFLGVGVGASAEVAGLPVTGSMVYSFGFNTENYRNELDKLMKSPDFSSAKLWEEYGILLRSQEFRDHESKFFIASLAEFLKLLFPAERRAISYRTSKPSIRKIDIKGLLSRKNSLGKMAAQYYSDPKFIKILDDNGLENLKQLAQITSSSFTGCDSIAGAAALSLSASPVAVTVGHSYYTRLLSIRLKTFLKLKGLSAFALANPFIMDADMLNTVIDLSGLFLNLRGKIKSCRSRQIDDCKMLLNNDFFHKMCAPSEVLD